MPNYDDEEQSLFDDLKSDTFSHLQYPRVDLPDVDLDFKANKKRKQRIHDPLHGNSSELITEVTDNKKKPVLFMTLVGAGARELEELMDVIEGTGLQDSYHGVLTSQPVHTMNTEELITALTNIYNVAEQGDPNRTGTNRMTTVRRHMRQTVRTTKETIRVVEEIESELNNLRSCVQAISSALMPHKILVPSISYKPDLGYAISDLKAKITLMEELLPKEGEEW